jgi:site-specific DNA recombinase
MSREVPGLRIVPDDLWTAAKSRQKHTWHGMKTAGAIGAAKRPQYLFSDLTKCGTCGAGFIISSKNRLGCFGARDQGRCDNHLTIRRDEVETRVLSALQDKLLRQDLFEEFCDESTREMNRLRMEHRASLSTSRSVLNPQLCLLEHAGNNVPHVPLLHMTVPPGATKNDTTFLQ